MELNITSPVSGAAEERLMTEEEAERAQTFKDRAEELRRLAPSMKDEAARAQLMQMAVSYYTLATRLETPDSD
ncbi:MAG: hypothetical protein ACREGR_05125 [Minisyncoccia bacterium]